MTLKEATDKCRKLGFWLTKNEGEYRVAPNLNMAGIVLDFNEKKEHTREELIKKAEAIAYYTDDIEDAVDTAKLMCEQIGQLIR